MTGIFETAHSSLAFRLGDVLWIGDEREESGTSSDGYKWSSTVRNFAVERLDEHGERRTRIEKMGAHQYWELRQRPLQIIPADRGTNIIRLYVEAEPVELFAMPVVAWALCFDGAVRPVTPRGVNDGTLDCDRDVYVEMPDGKIEGVGEHCGTGGFANRAEMVSAFTAIAARAATEAGASE